VGIPKGFPKIVGKVESRLLGFPCFPQSVISMACFGHAFHKVTIRREGPFWGQGPLVRDGDLSSTSNLASAVTVNQKPITIRS
jgi:hypothetical protein